MCAVGKWLRPIERERERENNDTKFTHTPTLPNYLSLSVSTHTHTHTHTQALSCVSERENVLYICPCIGGERCSELGEGGGGYALAWGTCPWCPPAQLASATYAMVERLS